MAGLSRAQISCELGVRNHKSLDRWLDGLPAPDWTRRPRAKESAKAAAVRLRREGKTFEQIRQILMQEQDHQIDLATALGIEVPDTSGGPKGRALGKRR